MAPRSAAVLRVALILIVLCAGWYSLQVYVQLYGKFSKPKISDDKIKEEEVHLIMKELDENELNAADEEWKKQQNLFQPIIKKLVRNPCSTLVSCTDNEFNFKLVTGAANAIGPSICFNGTIVMKNSLNNVDRGMNVGVFDGRTGKPLRQIVFDLFEKDSTDLKNFIRELKDEEIILVATADDAGHRLDEEAKELLGTIGSTHAKLLGFRDNWVFVGGKNIKHPSEFEKIIKNDKEVNKYGDWPEAISMEGCIPKLS